MACVKAELTLRNGEKKLFSEPLSEGSGEITLTGAHQSLLKLQKNVNDALTELVNAEKSACSQGDGGPADGELSPEEEDDEDEEEEEEKKSASNSSTENSEPVPKKLKT